MMTVRIAAAPSPVRAVALACLASPWLPVFALVFSHDGNATASAPAAPAPAPGPSPAAPAPARASARATGDYAGVTKHTNKKIVMVVETLKDILQSVINEERQETGVYNRYWSWCKNAMSRARSDVFDTRSSLGNAKVLLQEQDSKIESLKLIRAKIKKAIEETKDAIAQAVSLREEEKTKFEEEWQFNTQSLRQIKMAIFHVQKIHQEGGFLQNGVRQKLQINEPGESSYVLGVMKGLQDRLNKTRHILNRTEAEKVEMHHEFLFTKSDQLHSLKDISVEKRISAAETNAKYLGTKRKVARLTEILAKSIQTLSETEETCRKSRREWRVRQADRTKEKAALNEAIRYLLQTSFEQVSSSPSAEQYNDEEHDALVFVPSFLQAKNSAKVMKATSVVSTDGGESAAEEKQLEFHMRKDTFDGAITVVKRLLSFHGRAQHQDTTKKEFCEKELAEKEDDKATTYNLIRSIEADLGEKMSEVQTLAAEIKMLKASNEQIRKIMADATNIRKQELKVFQAGSKDRFLAIKVLNQAKDVLQRFYKEKDGNLLQAEPSRKKPVGPAPSKWSKSSARKTTASFGAVQMIQNIIDDVALEQKDAAIAEKQAVQAFGNLRQKSEQKTDENREGITDRVAAKAKLKVQTNTLLEKRTQKIEEYASILKQLIALHHECDELLKFYGKRKKARSFEVSQLRDVMDILRGSSKAIRTGFAQEPEEPDEDSPAERAKLFLGLAASPGLAGV